MADPTDGGAESSDPQPPTRTPPPGFAGGAPATPPPGFAGPLPGGPPGQVPVPPPRPPATPAKAKRGPFRLVVAVVVLVALGAGAFWLLTSQDDDDGGTTTTLSARGPGSVYAAWFAAIQAKDYAKACTLLSADTLARIDDQGTTCPAAMAAAAKATGDPGGRVEVLGEAVDGERAEVSYRIGDDDPSTDPAVLVREDGRWKLSLFAKATGTGSVAAADAASCDIEQRTVETAVQAYFASTGEYPPDAQALVGGFLQELPEHSKVNPDGTVTMTGDCA